MEVSIAPELEGYVAREVQSGKFQSADKVVEAALSLMARRDEEYQEELSAFQHELEERIAASDRGEVVDASVVFERLRRKSAEARRLDA